MLTSSGYLNHVDPALAYDSPENQVAVLTHDGLTGFLRVSGSAGLHSCPISPLPSPSRPTAAGPTASSCAAGSITRPARSCGRWTSAARSSARFACRARVPSMPGTTPTSSEPGNAWPLRNGPATSHGGSTRRSNTVTFHLTSPDPDFLSEARTPLGVCGARRHASPSRAIPTRHRPLSDCLVRSEAGHPAPPQPPVSRVVAPKPSRWLPGRDRRARQRLGRHKRLRGRAQVGRPRSGRVPAFTRRARIRPNTASRPAQAEPVGGTFFLALIRASPHSTMSASAGR